MTFEERAILAEKALKNQHPITLEMALKNFEEIHKASKSKNKKKRIK